MGLFCIALIGSLKHLNTIYLFLYFWNYRRLTLNEIALHRLVHQDFPVLYETELSPELFLQLDTLRIMNLRLQSLFL